MERRFRSLLPFVFSPLILFFISQSFVYPGKIKLGLDMGYDKGPGVFFHISSNRLFQLKGTGSRLGVGISFPNPGNAVLARKVFINNATNGIPEQYGRVINFRFDLIRPLKLKIYPKSKFYFGIRYAMFRGIFKYLGGNEEFSISSNNFGIGVGTEHYFRLKRRKYLKIITGIDYFFNSHIHGHDTTYYPNDENINPRENYKFGDADKSVNQPKIEFRLMFGITSGR